jgi:NAD(P)-dependent dehydrogenase (short-subunit alcohol dehydrogenase family)
MLAMEWGPDVRVNAISPGPVAGTQVMSRLAPDETTQDAYFARIPMRRWAEIGEVAEAALFLSSASAAYITGVIIDVDGGSQLGDASRNSLDKGQA